MSRALIVAALALLLTADRASAQTSGDPAGPEARAGEAERAADHFDRGIDFFNEGRFDAALAEFERAYELSPAYPVLYNLAKVHAAQGNAVRAADAFERYLDQGGDHLSRARRREVQAELETQRSRIGELMVETGVEGATVRVDGADVARTPLEQPVRLTAGKHAVSVRAPGYDEVNRVIQIAGTERKRLSLDLVPIEPPQGQLRLDANVEGATVRVDGRTVGTTPLESTAVVEAGEHVVTVERPGYDPIRRTIRVPDEGTAELEVTLERADSAPDEALSTLVVELPDAPYLLRVDGEVMPPESRLRLPVGPHRVEVEMAERQAFETRIDLPPGDERAFTPTLRWTPDARTERLERAERRSTAGRALTAVGSVLFLAGATTFVWNELQINDTDAELRTINAMIDECEGQDFDACEAPLRERGRALAADQDRQNAIRGISGASLAVGAALGITGALLWSMALTEEEIDRRAHAWLEVGPSSLRLRGSF